MAAELVSTVAQVKELVEKLENWSPSFPFLFIDLEGVNLSRAGSISILQLLIGPEPTVYILDVHRLEHAAFDTCCDSGLTLRQILESRQYPKILFDVRMDSDALFAHYQINLQCVIDLQLLEFITRPVSGDYLSGLAKCIERDAGLDFQEVYKWNSVKEAGRSQFAPEKGGRYEVFNERPLRPALTDYCVQDVQFMPRLLLRYGARLRPSQAVQVQRESAARIGRSQESVGLRKGRHMAIGPHFAPSHGSATANLSHPMDIICSPDLRTYCELKVPINRAPIAVAAEVDQSFTQNTSTTRVLSSALSLSHNSSAISHSFRGHPDTEIEPTPTKGPVTVAQALSQLSNRKTPDFTLSEAQYLQGRDDHDTEGSDDISELDKSFRSVGLSSPPLRRDNHRILGSQTQVDCDHLDANDDDYDRENESPRDYAACSAEDCGYCGNCHY